VTSPALGVALITPQLTIGGMELSTLTLARGLRRLGHGVCVMSIPGLLLDEYQRSGVEVVFGRVAGRKPWDVLVGAWDMRTLCATRRLDVLHCQSVMPTLMAFLASRSWLSPRPRVIWHDRGIAIDRYPIIARSCNVLTDLVIATSDFARDQLIRSGLSSDHVRRVHNCINVEFPKTVRRDRAALREFGVADAAFVVGTVSRLTVVKGHAYLLEAAAILREKISDLKIVIVGGGPLEDELKRLAEAKGVSDLVVFTGPRRDLEHLYSAMDVFVFPSWFETFGNAVLEAAAYGLPVVASAVGGLLETVEDARTGILVPPRDPVALAGGILYLAQNPLLATNMGAAGRERVKRYFLPSRVAAEVEEVYRYVLAH
jgi:glycosyltransferase involved in cell wall biosynthesis